MVRREGGFREKRRVTKNGIKGFFCMKILYITLFDGNLTCKGTPGNILPGLGHRGGVDVDTCDTRLRTTLRHHERYETRARAYVEHTPTALYPRPCSQQHPVGTYGMGALVVRDTELLKSEHGAKVTLYAER